tara:strand:+ start:2740 stop:3444 length:705 start_codon:yes stop_codon:yes gene_type:complete
MTSPNSKRLSLEYALEVASSKNGRRFHRFVWLFLTHLFGRFYCKVEGIDREYLDTPGPVIVAPVHRSNLDAPLLVTLTKRRLNFLGKESLFSPKPVAWFISALGGIPISRGVGDREALKAAQTLLEKEESIVVFPEGTRQIGKKVGEVYDGAAFLAARTGAKVIPVGIAGTEYALPSGAKFPKRTRVCYVVGEPMDLSNPEGGRISAPQRKDFSEELAIRLQEVFDEALAQNNN